MYNNNFYPQPQNVLQNRYAEMQQQVMGLRGRPVSSLEEARAAQIDFDGSLSLFPDVANNKIYTKQINLDGTASLKVYTQEAEPTPPPAPAYVTKDELSEILEKFKNSLGGKQDEPRPNSNDIIATL